MDAAERLRMRADFGGEAAHFSGCLVGAQEFAFGLVEAREQSEAFAIGEQVAGFIRRSDRDALQPGSAHGGGVCMRYRRLREHGGCEQGAEGAEAGGHVRAEPRKPA